ncbi:hypothetical protein SAMN05216599_105109 [Pseudomonas cichorii]|nr:hypothetical protein SAMN05216599_105109 [Pseudomonas cichorii]
MSEISEMAFSDTKTIGDFLCRHIFCNGLLYGYLSQGAEYSPCRGNINASTGTCVSEQLFISFF